MSDWKEMLIILRNTRDITVRFGSDLVAKADGSYQIDEFKEYYIGGAPQDFRERFVVIIFLFNFCLL